MTAIAIPAEERTEVHCCTCPTSAHGDGHGKLGGKCTMCPSCPGYRPRARSKPADSPITTRIRALAREGLDTRTIRERTGASRERINQIRREMGLAGSR